MNLIRQACRDFGMLLLPLLKPIVDYLVEFLKEMKDVSEQL